MTLNQFIETKLFRIRRHYPVAISSYGQYPYFVLADLLRQHQVDAKSTGAHSQKEVPGANLLQAYRAAQELKVEYLSIRTLLENTTPLTHQLDLDEALYQASHEAAWINSLEYRLFFMEQQRRFGLLLLPRFLQQEILSDPGVAAAQTLVEKLQSLRHALDRTYALYRSQIQPYPNYNPNIIAPLSPPEVDALKWLVADQALGLRAQTWKQYHVSLLQQESARYLHELAVYYASLQIRAEDFTNALQTAQARRNDRIEAEALRRREAHADYLNRVDTLLALPGALHVSLTAGISAGASVVASHQSSIPAITTGELTSAIGKAILEGAKHALVGALTKSPALLVGTVALLWPSSLANSERRADLALPLTELSDPDTLKAVAAAAPGQSIAMPHAVSVHGTAQGADVLLISADAERQPMASVVDLQFNETLGHYEVLIDTPARLITVTPAVTPDNASTRLPIVQLGPTVIEGADIVLHEPARQVTPGYPAQDVEAFILRFPAHTGLPPLYLSVGNPYGGTTRGTYSGRMYDPELAGGPIEELDWRDAVITEEGVALVRLHIGRFPPSADNKVMINRLDQILSHATEPTETDKKFYTHEIRELQRYRNLGIEDNLENKDIWNHAHTATLEDFKLSGNISELYTTEALNAE